MIKAHRERNTFYANVIHIDPCEPFAISFLASMANGQRVKWLCSDFLVVDLTLIDKIPRQMRCSSQLKDVWNCAVQDDWLTDFMGKVFLFIVLLMR
jgi:hypothetical protein